jgi:hypothetical protein
MDPVTIFIGIMLLGGIAGAVIAWQCVARQFQERVIPLCRNAVSEKAASVLQQLLEKLDDVQASMKRTVKQLYRKVKELILGVRVDYQRVGETGQVEVTTKAYCSDGVEYTSRKIEDLSTLPEDIRAKLRQHNARCAIDMDEALDRRIKETYGAEVLEMTA